MNIIVNIVRRENKTCYLLGDYNINILNYANHTQNAPFVDMMSSIVFLPLRPSAILIDNVAYPGSSVCLLVNQSGRFQLLAVLAERKRCENVINPGTTTSQWLWSSHWSNQQSTTANPRSQHQPITSTALLPILRNCYVYYWDTGYHSVSTIKQ